MEAIEASSVEAAILWLVQAILANLLLDKLEKWLCQVGLADDIQKLKDEIERVEGVVSAGKGRAVGNRALVRLLARLKELLYDADDVVDELDYFRLKHQVEGDTFGCADESEGMGGDEAEEADGSRESTHMLSDSRSRYRSDAWEHFDPTEFDNKGSATKARCKFCRVELKCEAAKGRSALRNHINKSKACIQIRKGNHQPRNSLSASDGAPNDTTDLTRNSTSRKRTRVDEELTHNTAANPHPWDKARFSNKIQQIARQLQDILLKLNEIHSVYSANLNHYQNSTLYQRLRTSSLAPRKIYGREEEKDYIIRVMRAKESDTLTVLPIVGIGGVGKTALAQLVYNDPVVEKQYERVWVWVSNEFDKVIVTRNMLDFFSQESHHNPRNKKKRKQPQNKQLSQFKKTNNYAKLQEILKGHMEDRSKRFLLILDDVWGSMDYDQWDELLAPLQSSRKKGNMIIVTTRNLFFAQRKGTVKPMKLGALKADDLWSLLKASAFGDDKYKGNQTLERIGSEMLVKKLKGSPLAAETAGSILRKRLTADHWNNIMENEDWKSLQHSRGIMASLKLSYDQLPYELQQCFLYCSIFPYNYQFVAEDLIDIWISQGFVPSNNSCKIEETGWEYLTELVGSGFFEYSDIEGSQTYLVKMPALMLDFARLVSRTECAVIDSAECNEIPSTIHHLSILTDSAYHNEDHLEDINRSKRFKEKLQSVITSVRKLRTVLLIGKCDHFLLQPFQHILEKAKYLRMLQISSRYESFDDAFLPNLVNSIHIRYLKVDTKGSEVIPMSKFYHLEVLNAGDAAIQGHMNALISMRRLVVKKGPHSSITGIDETSHPEELHNSTDQHSGSFEIRQLQSMNKLVHLQLENVARAKVDGAKVLREKQHMQKLKLLWEDTLSEDEYYDDDDDDEGSSQMNDTSSENFNQISDSNNIPSSNNFAETESDVLECLEPHHNLKYLQIFGYSGATSPSWLANSVSNLRALHLKDCGEWQILPSLENLPFLMKLKLKNMKKLTKVSIPSLEELVLFKLPKLELCSCSSVMDLSSSLRALKISNCRVLKSFPLFESCEKFNIEQKSWLSRLDKLTIHDCSQLRISSHLPPSNTVSELSIRGVLEVPDMMGFPEYIFEICNLSRVSEATILDDKRFAYHNLRMLTSLTIANQNRVYISFEGFRQLINLKDLQIFQCKEIFSSDEYMAAANNSALLSLRHLRIDWSGITGKCLSVLLRHVKAVEEFNLFDCQQITALSIEEEESNLSDLRSSAEASSSGNSYNNALAISPSDGLLRMPSNLLSSVKKMSIWECDELIYQGSKVEFTRFASLEELDILGCPKLIPSLVHSGANNDPANGSWFLPLSLRDISIYDYESPETLQLCFPGDRNSLKSLQVFDAPSLKSLQLHSCTALEELKITACKSLDTLEGLQSLAGLRFLKVFSCPGFPLSLEGYELCSRLEFLEIDRLSFLSMPFCMRLTSLKHLKLYGGDEEATKLTCDQENAIQLLTSLQELQFRDMVLEDLPVGLDSLPSLRKLVISGCPRITRVPEQCLLPSLEQLEIWGCSEELAEQCRMLATSKRKVIINWEYVS